MNRERRTMPTEIGQVLVAARMRAGLRGREAARLGGISPSHLCALESGQRVPSRTVAQILIDLLRLEPTEAEQLLAVSVDDAGRGYWKRQREQQKAESE